MQPIRAGSKALIREINAALVLGRLRTQPLQSRTDLARHTGLSLPTISEIVAELLGSGLIEERATGRSGGGRRPVLLALKPDAGYVVGIKLTETRVIAVLTDLEATIVAQDVTAVPDASVEAVVDAVAAAVARVRVAARDRPVYGVGVGMAGVVDRARGVVRHATYSDWHDVDLADLLIARTGLPVALDNDVNTLVANEKWFGAGRGVDDVAVVSIGRGVGLGLVLDGRLYRGATGGAGEFGHTKVIIDGPECACGGRGCLEALIGEPALRAQASTVLGRTVDLDEAATVARQGNAEVREIFRAAGRLLGTAVGNLVNLLNPKLVVLAGEGTRVSDLLRAEFDLALSLAVFDGLQHDLETVVDTWDDEAWAQGAAGLFLGELFQPNLRPDEAGRPSLTARKAVPAAE
ncbi:putative NBD/HSP70 family sugar kinase [Kibdelosporangium banguiense]|uniref:NBD/HSP70 family sugar kinase n=1 Tax=Kibdelosporangium banguiense TaxID=1365924 RepID=A0ABS4TRG2_9PSEU|nr:ROK family transcriptional regulator [Kibdelosporangium banguiense]MBP2326997.1 putative NBD/HSP70 family sugar kinase [Kibdelosporangium banguiense]